MPSPFLLSHHHPPNYDRCVHIGGVALCARCLGLYPTLFLGLAVQISCWRPPQGWHDWPVALLLPLPALLDWASGRLDPRSGTNARRILTGVLLGGALSRTLFLHFLAPGHPVAMVQFALIAAVFGFVEVLVRRRRQRLREELSENADVEGCRPDGKDR